jgi:hypothetical protein
MEVYQAHKHKDEIDGDDDWYVDETEEHGISKACSI